MLLGGYQNTDGNYYDLGSWGNYWTSTAYDATYAWIRQLNSGEAGVYRDWGYNKAYRFSVRCVKEFNRNAFFRYRTIVVRYDFEICIPAGITLSYGSGKCAWSNSVAANILIDNSEVNHRETENFLVKKTGHYGSLGGNEWSGSYNNLGSNGYYWTSTAYDSSNAWMRNVNSGNTGVNRNNWNKVNRLSVRCVKEFDRDAFLYLIF